MARMLNVVERQFGIRDVTSGFCMPDAWEQQVQQSLRRGCHHSRTSHAVCGYGTVQYSRLGIKTDTIPLRFRIV
jgi:hypothetical protein